MFSDVVVMIDQNFWKLSEEGHCIVEPVSNWEESE